LTSERGFTAISHYFVMDWAAVWLDIVGGLLIAGALAEWVPHAFWQSFFLPGHPILATLWGPGRASRRGHLFRLLGWEYSTGRGPLERRHQFWLGHRVHLRVIPVLNIY